MLLGFKERFFDPILIGTKVFTLRGPRKKEPKIGETLYMYTGLRTNKCRLISKNEKLVSKQMADISISRNLEGELDVEVWVDGYCLDEDELAQFVKYDGFVDLADFADYWIKSSYAPKKPPVAVCVGGPMNLYHWTDLRY